MAIDNRYGIPNSGSATLAASQGSGSVVQLLNPATLAVYSPSRFTADYTGGTAVTFLQMFDAAGTITNVSNLPDPLIQQKLAGTIGATTRVHDDLEGMRDIEEDVLVTIDGGQDHLVTVRIQGHELQGGQRQQ